MKCAILVAMADEPPFSEIKNEIHSQLASMYRGQGFDVYYVYARKSPNWARKIRRLVEEIRWGKFYVFLRVYDFAVLNLYRFYKPRVELSGDKITVNTPEDIRHLSVKILGALELLVRQGYEVVIRTTVSSILNPRLLSESCTDISQDELYYGGRKIAQDDGFQFVSGSFTVLNKKAAIHLFGSRKQLDFSLVDDVCFGKFFQNQKIAVKSIQSHIVREKSEVPPKEDLLRTVHYRCRTGVKIRDDVSVMKYLIGQLAKLNGEIKDVSRDNN